jgi:hypothetical protein
VSRVAVALLQALPCCILCLGNMCSTWQAIKVTSVCSWHCALVVGRLHQLRGNMHVLLSVRNRLLSFVWCLLSQFFVHDMPRNMARIAWAVCHTVHQSTATSTHMHCAAALALCATGGNLNPQWATGSTSVLLGPADWKLLSRPVGSASWCAGIAPLGGGAAGMQDCVLIPRFLASLCMC